MTVTLIGSYYDDDFIVACARVMPQSPVSFGEFESWAKDEERDEKLLQYMIDNSHTSPFEHPVMTWYIEAPLYVWEQLKRHRTAKYSHLNQQSRRYGHYEVKFEVPTQLRKQSSKNHQGSDGDLDSETNKIAIAKIEAVQKFAKETYDELEALGVANELSRIVLPQTLLSSAMFSCDLHNLMHLFSLRLDSHAQTETKNVVQQMYKDFQDKYPIVARCYEKRKSNSIYIKGS